MKIIDKDITTITEGIIVHQVNTAGVMGAGVAKALADKHPQLLPRYQSFTNLLKDRSGKEALLGKICWFSLFNPGKELYIANLYGQHLDPSSGFKENRRTSYDATVEGWLELKRSVADYPVYIPYLMGCGLGGGNWNIYSAIVDEIMGPDTVTACRI